MLLPPLGWPCLECVIRRKRDVREENTHIYVARTRKIRVIPDGVISVSYL